MSVGFEEAAGPAGLRIYAIGDVHGRLDLLRRLHAMIDDEIAAAAEQSIGSMRIQQVQEKSRWGHWIR